MMVMLMIMAMRRRATWQKGQMSSVRSRLDNGGTGALALVTSTWVVKMMVKIDFLCNTYLRDEKELRELKNQYLLLERCIYSLDFGDASPRSIVGPIIVIIVK